MIVLQLFLAFASFGFIIGFIRMLGWLIDSNTKRDEEKHKKEKIKANIKNIRESILDVEESYPWIKYMECLYDGLSRIDKFILSEKVKLMREDDIIRLPFMEPSNAARRIKEKPFNYFFDGCKYCFMGHYGKKGIRLIMTDYEIDGRKASEFYTKSIGLDEFRAMLDTARKENYNSKLEEMRVKELKETIKSL